MCLGPIALADHNNGVGVRSYYDWTYGLLQEEGIVACSPPLTLLFSKKEQINVAKWQKHAQLFIAFVVDDPTPTPF